MKKLIALALAALATAQITSQEVIDLALGVRKEAAAAGEWLSEHEAELEAAHIRLTGSSAPPATEPPSAATEDVPTQPATLATASVAAETLAGSPGSVNEAVHQEPEGTISDAELLLQFSTERVEAIRNQGNTAVFENGYQLAQNGGVLPVGANETLSAGFASYIREYQGQMAHQSSGSPSNN